MKKLLEKIILSDVFVKITVYTGAMIFTFIFSIQLI